MEMFSTTQSTSNALDDGLIRTSSNPLPVHGHTVVPDGAKPRHKTMPLGERVARVFLIAPTIIEYIWLAYAHLWGTAELVDDACVAHTVVRSRTENFEHCFFNASIVAYSGLNAHSWLTLNVIARRYKLDQPGAVDGEGYAARLAAAQLEAGQPAKAERIHVGVVCADWFFAAYVVFAGSFQKYGPLLDYIIQAAVGVLPVIYSVVMNLFVVPHARRNILNEQRLTSVVFSGDALRGTLSVMAFSLLLFARFVAYAYNSPTDLFAGDCEWLPNGTCPYTAHVNSCTAELFRDGKVPDSDAMLELCNYGRKYQFNATCAILYYLGANFLYYVARGQNRLHDKLFTELDMTWTHVIALVFWLLASFAVTVSLSVMWTGWDEGKLLSTVAAVIHVCDAIGILGISMVLWMDVVVVSIRTAVGSSSSERRDATHTIFASMRFVNGQPLPEAVKLRDELKKRKIHLVIVELKAGADINQEVFQSIEHAEAFLIFGTSSYGEKTANPACTYFESEYARNAGKKMILLRMIPWDGRFEHLQARVLFGMNELVLTWVEETEMPESLPDDIASVLAE